MKNKWTAVISLLILVAISGACGISEKEAQQRETKAFSRGYNVGEKAAEDRCTIAKEKMKGDFQVELENQKSIAFFGGAVATLVGGVVLMIFGGLIGAVVYLLRHRTAKPTVEDFGWDRVPRSVTDDNE